MKDATAKQRLVRLLAEDKETINSQTEAAARRDFSRVAKEYFETDGELLFKVEREKNAHRVQIGFSAVRVKNFTPLK